VEKVLPVEADAGRQRQVGPHANFVLKEAAYHRLEMTARKSGDRAAVQAVTLAGVAVLPLLEAVRLVIGGFAVYLVSDLKEGYFLDEMSYLEQGRSDSLPESALVVRIDPYINEVLKRVTDKTHPVTIRAADLVCLEELSKVEVEIVELLRKRDFDRVVVEPRGGGFRLEFQCDVSAEGAEEVVRLLEEHEYQSVTVKKQSGKIVRVTQSVSLKV
jgi:hypothetical protein